MGTAQRQVRANVWTAWSQAPKRKDCPTLSLQETKTAPQTAPCASVEAGRITELRTAEGETIMPNTKIPPPPTQRAARPGGNTGDDVLQLRHQVLSEKMDVLLGRLPAQPSRPVADSDLVYRQNGPHSFLTDVAWSLYQRRGSAPQVANACQRLDTHTQQMKKIHGRDVTSAGLAGLVPPTTWWNSQRQHQEPAGAPWTL